MVRRGFGRQYNNISQAFSTVLIEKFRSISVHSCLSCCSQKGGRFGNSSLAFSSSSSLLSGIDHEHAKLRREALALVERASFKVQGSKHHAKLRRRHIAIFCDAIRSGLLHNKSTLYNDQYSKYSCEATKELTANLGEIGANMGIMPDFSNARALRGYALGHFGRARLLSELVAQPEPDWLISKVSQIFSESSDIGSSSRKNRDDSNIDKSSYSLNDENEITVASLGGGCGYDFVALVALSEFLKGPKIAATVYEYEPAWKDVLADVESVVQDVLSSKNNNITSPPHKCAFESCDITSPLDSSSNEALASVVESTQIFSCSYVVAENAIALRKNKFEFFRQLFSKASDGSLFFFTETTHRLWPELIDLASKNDHLASSSMRIAVPHIRCGKSGCQLALLKDCAAGDRGNSTNSESVLDEYQQKLYERFQIDNLSHLSRLDRGWKRDKRKVRGAK